MFLNNRHTQNKMDELLNIAMECNYSTTDLMDDTHHLFNSHGFISNNESYAEIKHFMLNTQTVGKCSFIDTKNNINNKEKEKECPQCNDIAEKIENPEDYAIPC